MANQSSSGQVITGFCSRPSNSRPNCSIPVNGKQYSAICANSGSVRLGQCAKFWVSQPGGKPHCGPTGAPDSAFSS